MLNTAPDIFGGISWLDSAALQSTPPYPLPPALHVTISTPFCASVRACLRLQAALLDQQEAAVAAAAAGSKTALPATGEPDGSSLGQKSSAAATDPTAAAAAAAAAAGTVGRGARGKPPLDAMKREKALAAADTAMVETMAEVCMYVRALCAWSKGTVDDGWASSVFPFSYLVCVHVPFSSEG